MNVIMIFPFFIFKVYIFKIEIKKYCYIRCDVVYLYWKNKEEVNYE